MTQVKLVQQMSALPMLPISEQALVPSPIAALVLMRLSPIELLCALPTHQGCITRWWASYKPFGSCRFWLLTPNRFERPSCAPAKAENAPFLPGLSAVVSKPVQLAFDGGRLTSDADVLVLAEIECKLQIAERLAAASPIRGRPSGCGTTTDKPVAAILRPGKTPDGAEGTRMLRHLDAISRTSWPRHLISRTQ